MFHPESSAPTLSQVSPPPLPLLVRVCYGMYERCANEGQNCSVSERAALRILEVLRLRVAGLSAELCAVSVFGRYTKTLQKT